MVPPFAVGSTFRTSTARQSRNHEGRSLRISATWKNIVDHAINEYKQEINEKSIISEH